MDEERRIGFYAYEKIGMSTVDLDLMVAMGEAVLEEVNGEKQYRVFHPIDSRYDMIYKFEEKNV